MPATRTLTFDLCLVTVVENVSAVVVVVGRGEAILWCYSAHPSSEISQLISFQILPFPTAVISYF